MSRNTNSEMVEQMIRRQYIYCKICEPNWESFCDTVNALLRLESIQAWDALGNILEKKELQVYEAFYNEWHMLKFAVEIYEYEKVCGIKQVIFMGVKNMQGLEEKINCLKFGVLRVENEIAIDEEFKEEWGEKHFSLKAIEVVCKKMCRNPSLVFNNLTEWVKS